MNNENRSDEASDKPIKLERTEILDRLKRLLNLDTGTLTAKNILLAGPWGAGKTTLLRELETDLQGDQYYVIKFSPWAQLAHEDPRQGFLKHLGAVVWKLNQQNKTKAASLKGQLKEVWDAMLLFVKEMEDPIKAEVTKLLIIITLTS